MAYEEPVNGITLFKNDRKQEGEKTPDWRGKLNVGGTLYEVAMWEKPSRSGGVFLSGKIQPPRSPGGQNVPAQATAPAAPPIDQGDIPF